MGREKEPVRGEGREKWAMGGGTRSKHVIHMSESVIMKSSSLSN